MNNMSQLSELVSRLQDARVVCVGDLMLDRYVEGTVDRVSPEAPIPVLAEQREIAMLGGVGNVLRNLAALGAACDLAAVIGIDRAGRELAKLVAREARVTPRLLSIPGRQTSIKTRFVAGGQQLLRSDRETTEPISATEQASMLEDARSALQAAENTVMVLSDYGKGVLETPLLQDLIALAKGANIPVIADPKGRDFSRYRGVSMLTPNRQELAAATAMPTGSDENVIAACRKLIADFDVGAILATRSERGMSLVTREEAHHFPARTREVFDVSGAGDTVIAVLAAAMAAGTSAPEAAQLANVAAGVVVGKVGTAVAHSNEILAALHASEFMDAEAKVVAVETLIDRASTWRRQGWRVGFTNGCFDLLHPGHVSLLKQAKATCDRLVVGLNSDASVRRLKGPDRPIQSEGSRSSVLASLAVVDLVVIFHEETPLALIEALRPDVLVKGSDYAVDEVVGAEKMRSWGGEIVLADILTGYSTTNTIRRMAK